MANVELVRRAREGDRDAFDLLMISEPKTTSLANRPPRNHAAAPTSHSQCGPLFQKMSCAITRTGGRG